MTNRLTAGSLARVLAFILMVGGCGAPGDTAAGGRGNSAADPEPRPTGPYLGQVAPGAEPVLFAPGLVSTGLHTRDLAMTPAGDEIYFSVQSGPFATILGSRLASDGWSAPEVAGFSADPRLMNIEPHISPDGGRFYFVSNRPADGSAMPKDRIGRLEDADIWAMERTGDGWGEPHNIGPPVNTESPEFFPSTTLDGTLYFTREEPGTRRNLIYRARRTPTGFAEPEQLPGTVNSANQFNAFIAPDESYLILGVFGREDSLGGTDYYIAFRHADDTWSEPLNLGPGINRARGAEWSPYVSPDGRYFFFMSTRAPYPDPPPDRLTFEGLRSFHAGPESGNPAIYWMDASFIDELRRSAETPMRP